MTDAQIEADKEAPAEYAVVEIFGHQTHVGRITEEERFGAKMMRIDVPHEGDFARGFSTFFYGGSSIFSLTLCDLATVVRHNGTRLSPARLTRAEDHYEDDVEGQPGSDEPLF